MYVYLSVAPDSPDGMTSEFSTGTPKCAGHVCTSALGLLYIIGPHRSSSARCLLLLQMLVDTLP